MIRPAHERAAALREAHEVAAAETYFASRHQLDCGLMRSVYEAGYRACWGQHEALREAAQALLAEHTEFTERISGQESPQVSALREAVRGLC